MEIVVFIMQVVLQYKDFDYELWNERLKSFT